jgi:c-di-GMP-binding flagellar brake protein YcgR
MPPMPADQRRYERKALRVTFRVRGEQGEGTLELESSDLSAGGVFLVSDLLLEQGEALMLEVVLPPSNQPVVLPAKVVWVRRFPMSGETAGMGVEFVSLGDDARLALLRALESGTT